jgi:predicted membrane channel-forming protein YqfA (hemolysin III family)
MFVVFGFIIMNYTDEMFNSVIYLVGFILAIYSIFGLYTILMRKSELY